MDTLYLLVIAFVALQLHTSWPRFGRSVKNRKGYRRNCYPLKGDCCKNVWASVIRLWNRHVVWILFLRLWCRVQLNCVATVSDEYVASIVSGRGDVCPEDGGSRFLGTCGSNCSVSYRSILIFDVTVRWYSAVNWTIFKVLNYIWSQIIYLRRRACTVLLSHKMCLEKQFRMCLVFLFSCCFGAVLYFWTDYRRMSCRGCNLVEGE
jgi:hypothetical protein